MVIRKPTQQQVKLHRPTERAPDARPRIWSRIDQLCASFTAATGYHLKVVDAEEQPPAAEALWQREIPSCAAAPARLILLKPADAARVPLAIAKGLAEPFSETIVELQQALEALWQREGDLAAAVPLIVRPREEETQLANRLAAVLRAGAEAVGGTAAALYLLDDDTRYLKLRSHWGLNHQRLVAPPRPLRGAKADLEALTGHAIVLEDTRPLRHWNIPEDYPAAVCVPVSTATIPLGTLWIFADDPRDFTPPEVNLIEVVAGRLAVELEREILLRSIMHSDTGRSLSDALCWQKSAAAHLLPELPGWRWAARTGRMDEELHGDFCLAQTSPANSVDLAILSAHAGGLAGTLTAALLEGAIRAMPPEASPAARLNTLHQLLQQHSTPDQFASIFCSRVDAANGHIEMVTAGQTDVFVIRPHGWQPIATARTRAAGTAGPASLATLETQLSVGDMLLAVTGIPRQAPHLYASRQVDARDLAECVLRHNHLAAADIVAALPTLFQPGMSTWQQPPATLLAQRLEAP